MDRILAAITSSLGSRRLGQAARVRSDSIAIPRDYSNEPELVMLTPANNATISAIAPFLLGRYSLLHSLHISWQFLRSAAASHTKPLNGRERGLLLACVSAQCGIYLPCSGTAAEGSSNMSFVP